MRYTTANMLKSLRKRKKTSTKGDNCSVLVIVGSEEHDSAVKICEAAHAPLNIMFKGPVDEVISMSTTTHNKCGNAVMTTVEAGDVLAGLCSGIRAQSNSPGLVANAATYINRKTADYLRKKLGRTLTASDIVANMHKIYK